MAVRGSQGAGEEVAGNEGPLPGRVAGGTEAGLDSPRGHPTPSARPFSTTHLAGRLQLMVLLPAWMPLEPWKADLGPSLALPDQKQGGMQPSVV